MAKVMIEMNDTLEERVESAIDSVKQELLDFLEANPDQDELPCLNNDLDYSGAIHEIVDGSVPCYTKELADNYYLHDSELDQAFDNAGCSTRDEAGDNYIAQAHYFYIQEQVNNWYYNEAQDIFDEWMSARTFTVKVDEHGTWVYNPENEEIAHISKETSESENFDLEDYLKINQVIPKDARLDYV